MITTMSTTSKLDPISQQKVNLSRVYKFHLELEYRREVAIWRTLEIPENYTFYDFHVSIQDSLNWSDVELHKFDVRNPVTKQMEYIGISDDLMCEPIIAENTALIANYFSLSNWKCIYTYNYVKPSSFRITLEKILPVIVNIKYPRCIAGDGVVSEENPEDSDSVICTQLPFELKTIKFRDPKEAWLDAFQGF